MKNCPVCLNDYDDSETFQEFSILNNNFSMCSWCGFRVMQFVDGTIQHCVANIYWGAGRVCWSSWFGLRDIIRKYKIKEVLEMGIGLSSELFVNEGLNLIGIDILKQHVGMYQNLLPMKAAGAKFYWYPDSDHITDIESIYPGRKWDFVFVDGPQERSREVKLAMRLSSRFIYLHDPNLGEQSFFPDENWCRHGNESAKLFERKEFFNRTEE
ncbi:MAG TPA: hypothetical protein VMW91_05885 [Desulfosporosinus sp.]|nr:hypothetical protein [Desulfosporosinus sp.]